VLLIEDDADIREVLAGVLRDEGYDVGTAANGKEGLEWLRAHEPPFLVLLDLMMPVMDGYAFRAEQRADPALKQIPVVVITAGTMDERVKAMDLNGAFKKPIDLNVLLDTVEKFSRAA
jgi:CheY-like chemotaxis protein